MLNKNDNFSAITYTIAVLFPSNLYKVRSPMQNTKKLALAVLVQTALISTAFASEQSESKVSLKALKDQCYSAQAF